MTEPTRHAFQAEVAEVLKLVVTSLYSNKEVFLRELVSNSADALDKLRFQGLSRPELLTEGENLSIKITTDPTAKTVTIADNGIGMTETELTENLGTIARSGTREFAKMIEQAHANAESAPHLIGQFGVGFYSVFMAASRVKLITRRAGSDAPATLWESTGENSYTVEETEKPTRGTEITVYLKDDATEYPTHDTAWMGVIGSL